MGRKSEQKPELRMEKPIELKVEQPLPLHKQRIPPELMKLEAYFVSLKSLRSEVNDSHLSTIRAFIKQHGGKPRDTKENYDRIMKLYFG